MVSLYRRTRDVLKNVVYRLRSLYKLWVMADQHKYWLLCHWERWRLFSNTDLISFYGIFTNIVLHLWTLFYFVLCSTKIAKFCLRSLFLTPYQLSDFKMPVVHNIHSSKILWQILCKFRRVRREKMSIWQFQKFRS